MFKIVEQYEAKCPRHIIVAGGEFFEADEKKKRQDQAIDFEPPAGFHMRIVLERYWPSDGDVVPSFYMYLYLTLDRDFIRKEFAGKKRQMDEGSLTASNYRIIVDEKQEIVETGIHETWAWYMECYHGDKNDKKIESAHITIGVPGPEPLKRARKMIDSLFEDVRVWKSGRDDIEEITEETLEEQASRKARNAEEQEKKYLEELYQDESLIFVEFLLPLDGTFCPDGEEDPSKCVELDEKVLVPYKKEIEKRADWINSLWREPDPPINMITDFEGSDSVNEKAIRGDVSIKEENGLYVCTTFILREALTAGEIEELEEHMLEVYSEGWGADFSNHNVKVDGGSLHLVFTDWEPADFIYRQIGPPYRSKEGSKIKQAKKEKGKKRKKKDPER